METTPTDNVVLLLSDSDPFLLKVYQYKFSKIEGWNTRIALSSEELKDIVLQEKPSLIVTDIILKTGNAYATIEEIKANPDPRISSIPIIILTDLGQKVDIDRAKKLGTTEYLIKSQTSFNDLLDTVKKAQGNPSLSN